jgi:hypothetical protein
MTKDLLLPTPSYPEMSLTALLGAAMVHRARMSLPETRPKMSGSALSKTIGEVLDLIADDDFDDFAVSHSTHSSSTTTRPQ